MLHPTSGWTIGRLLAHLNGAVDRTAVAGVDAATRDRTREPSPNLIPVPMALNAGIYNALFGLRAGAPLVKLFPIPGIGPGFVRACLGPLPFLRIVPTSGVTRENAAEYLGHEQIDGALVGGASLDPGKFRQICSAGANGAI